MATDNGKKTRIIETEFGRYRGAKNVPMHLRGKQEIAHDLMHQLAADGVVILALKKSGAEVIVFAHDDDEVMTTVLTETADRLNEIVDNALLALRQGYAKEEAE